MSLRSLALLLLAVGTFSGCQTNTYPGYTTYLNHSTKEVWVERAQGIKGEYGCGILIPDGNKGIIGFRSAAPSAVTLHWSYSNSKSDIQTAIQVPSPPTRNSELQLVFTQNESWIAKWKE
jgi:hypothetical protein